MSEILQEKVCGKATMYVITEQGLEIGPFVYGKETDSRVLCTNTGHIYYSRRKESRGTHTTNSSIRRDPEEKRRLRIIDLGNSLPLESLAGGSSGRQAFRYMENCGLATGNFRTSHALRRSGKQRVNKDKDELEYKLAEKSQLHLEMLKQVLNDSVRDEKYRERKKHEKVVFSDKKENERSPIGSRQTELRKLQVKRKSEVLMEELAKWREKSALNEKEVDSETDLGKKQRELKVLKEIFYPSRIKTANDRNVLPCLNLPSLKRVSATQNSKKELKEDAMTAKENSSTNINSKLNSRLIFLNPNSLYSQVKAETTAKLNINECKLSTVKPKVRFPSVIDQRTGEMHSVPGVVTYRPCDYNRWSRRRNIVRRNILHSRSPLVTYVNIFPSVSEKKEL